MIRSCRPPFRAPSAAALFVALMAALSCATQAPPPAGAPASTPAAAPAPTPPAAPAQEPAGPFRPPTAPPAEDDPTIVLLWRPGEEVPLEPPDGVWLKDEEGREYYTIELPKRGVQHIWLEPDRRVQLQYGMVFDVAAHDDERFLFKVYREQTFQTPLRRPVPTEEERAQVASTYRLDAGTAHRITLRPFDRGLPKSGQWRNGFDLADMNGDGHLDIVFGPARKGQQQPNIFLGDGAGGWRLWREARFPKLAYDYGDAAVADFNGDGRPDIALGMHLRGLAVLVADGPASFKSWGEGLDYESPDQLDEQGSFSSRAIGSADWNGDGRLDIVALGEGPRMSAAQAAKPLPSRAYGMVVYLNQGDGTWVRRDEIGASSIFGDNLALGDVDGDGNPDALLGSAVLGERDILRLGKGADWAVSAPEGLRPRQLVGAVAIADFDRDGRSDLAVGYQSAELREWRSGIDVLYGRGGGKWERKTLAVEDGRHGVFSLASGELDGDGRLDLVALTGDGRVWVFLGDQKGFFSRDEQAEVRASPDRCRGYAVALRDLDGDGRDEVVAAFAGEPSALFDPERCVRQGALWAWTAAVEAGP